jgi:hypothetical protein
LVTASGAVAALPIEEYVEPVDQIEENEPVEAEVETTTVESSEEQS